MLDSRSFEILLIYRVLFCLFVHHRYFVDILEFESILIEAKSSNRTKIKLVRKEALYFGFEMCYKEKRYNDILEVAKKLDNTILENSSELNDFVEAAEIMVEGLS